MIKRNNKKGFTIVELVIVIAVIAILAAVLIPTFAGIIKKAQLSSDQQAVRNMNVALAASGDLADINAVIDALAENGFNSKKALIPVSKDHGFFYYEAAKCVVLVNTADSTVVYPEDIAYDANGISLESSVVYLDAQVEDEAGFAEAVANGQKDIKLEADITVKNALVVLAGKEANIDLNGKTLTVDGYSDSTNGKHYYAFDVYGTLTLSNGTLNSRGVQTYVGAELIIKEGVTINAIDDNGGAAIYNRGTITIEGGTFNATKAQSALVGASALINDGGNVTIKGGTFNAAPGSAPYAISNWSGTMVIDNATVTAGRGGVAVTDGTVTINNANITLADGAEAYCVYAGGGEAIINAATLTGGAKPTCTENSGKITDNRN